MFVRNICAAQEQVKNISGSDGKGTLLLKVPDKEPVYATELISKKTDILSEKALDVKLAQQAPG